MCTYIGTVGRVFANVSGDQNSLPDQVISKLKKCYLIPPC